MLLKSPIAPATSGAAKLVPVQKEPSPSVLPKQGPATVTTPQILYTAPPETPVCPTGATKST